MATNPTNPNNNNPRQTRSNTRAGLHPPPPPLYSPEAHANETSEAGEPDVVPTDPSISTTAQDSAVKHFPEDSGRKTFSAAPAVMNTDVKVEELSGFPALSHDAAVADAPGFEPASGEDEEGWVPVTRKTSRTHTTRRNSNGSDIVPASPKPTSDDKSDSSTIDKAVQNMSHAELEANARRFQAMSNRYLAEIARKGIPAGASGDAQKENGGYEPPKEHEGMLIDFEDDAQEPGHDNQDGSSIQENASAGPSRKGKGADPGNWGDVAEMQNFSEKDLQQQEEMLANYAEIHRINKQNAKVPTIQGNFAPANTSTPARNASPNGRRSKSPKAHRPRARIETPSAPEGIAPVPGNTPEALPKGDSTSSDEPAQGSKRERPY
ncbi:hypothetical protein FB45DRAFT_873875 [Roridomyces roridus]|uniref:Uncharacterized protein n=1 Tax=Roridomyces roridus TaxID=1738132 RepID=A0AAD7FBL9_9AGAR|nr:hypothetical protein FB45DRAFT_873875 [Roridomyces roridus]